MTFKFIVLPKSHPSPSKWLQLADRYKAFRLLSLRLSPESFGSTYAREVAFLPDKWTGRLSNPQATTLIVVDVPSDSSDINSLPTVDDFELALDAEWLASLVISGPLDAETVATHRYFEESFVDSAVANESGRPVLQYVLNGMYVIPSFRGKRLGAQLVEHAKRYVAEQMTASKENVRLSLSVDYDNSPARKTYEMCGFKVVHRYWFDDYRAGRGARTEAAVMVLDFVVDNVEGTADL
ncbi:GNAT family [Colletotrichum truncatum]|uniref:GNAT family n=1 Tax=Colletotrichum truncatum TaxID=5467 RepID=A0ACC3ZGW1_COLTU|nr:GNAT family [Colletotrichum truncatum]KAF6790510.1 GNAT family [Colletotrichum truncatum]